MWRCCPVSPYGWRSASTAHRWLAGALALKHDVGGELDLTQAPVVVELELLHHGTVAVGESGYQPPRRWKSGVRPLPQPYPEVSPPGTRAGPASATFSGHPSLMSLKFSMNRAASARYFLSYAA